MQSKNSKVFLALFLTYISTIFNNLNNRKENTSITTYRKRKAYEKCVLQIFITFIFLFIFKFAIRFNQIEKC